MMTQRTIYIQSYVAPCGELELGEYEGKLCLCDWRKDSYQRLQRALKATICQEKTDLLAAAQQQLDEYFAGQRKTFDIPLMLVGTDFQKRVWQALFDIPYGKTLSYKELAAQMNMPKAVRAIASANGANTVSLFVPCHRVIGADGSLTGYRGGLSAKQYLLALEKTSV